MRRTLLAVLAIALAPSRVSAGGTPTFCTDATLGACFYMESLYIDEVASSVAGKSDYYHTLTGTWVGSALSGLTDLYWLARFDAYETSSLGRSVYLFDMAPGEPTQAWHDEYGQDQGLALNLWEYLSIVIYQGAPFTEGRRLVTKCGGGCYVPLDILVEPQFTEVQPVSVPEPVSMLLLVTGLVGLAAVGRCRA
ncbi:MAG: PEP-CTERM sorting domain-containing protein [Vicinamibacterales bacterium]